mmetsp:Transcript_39991/g.96540  ORF Transcript_39991/g.96540 Transcript_39991/m.96540 type:complete len:277 (+) Transcript_39991:1510-2340(+)
MNPIDGETIVELYGPPISMYGSCGCFSRKSITTCSNLRRPRRSFGSRNADNNAESTLSSISLSSSLLLLLLLSSTFWVVAETAFVSPSLIVVVASGSGVAVASETAVGGGGRSSLSRDGSSLTETEAGTAAEADAEEGVTFAATPDSSTLVLSLVLIATSIVFLAGLVLPLLIALIVLEGVAHAEARAGAGTFAADVVAVVDVVVVVAVGAGVFVVGVIVEAGATFPVNFEAYDTACLTVVFPPPPPPALIVAAVLAPSPSLFFFLSMVRSLKLVG